jgi:methyl-accepting chemotaxis protein
MGQPLRTTSRAEEPAEASSEPLVLNESPSKAPTLVVVPSGQTNAAPRTNHTYKRRWISMVHPLQVRMLSQVIAYSLIIFVLLAIPVFRPLMQALDNPTLTWQERAVVANDLLNLHARFWPWALGAGVVVLIHCIHSLRLMHRIAGPLYRLKHVFPQIGSGNLCVRTTLRQGDYLTPEADLVNQMTAQLQSKITALKHTQVMLALDAARIRELATANEDPALTSVAKQMEQNLSGLKSSLDTFKTSG